MNALFYVATLIYFSLHAVSSRTLKNWSHVFSVIYALCNHKVLTSLSFLTFLFAVLHNSTYSTYVYNPYIVSFDIIRPLGGICDKQGFNRFLTTSPNCSVDVTVAVCE